MSERKFWVLVVDDEEKDRSAIRILLDRQFQDRFQILEAESAAGALEILQNQLVDVLIVDIHMPGMSGLELVKNVRTKWEDLYIIMLTAYNYFEYAKEAIRYQVNDFLLKPPIRSEFFDTIQRFLDAAREKTGGTQIEAPTRKVLAKELGDCIMLNAEREKIDAYRNLLGIREDRVFCVLADTGIAENEEILHGTLEGIIEETAVPHAVSYTKNRMAIFCFTKQEKLGLEELGAAEKLKRKLQAALGETAGIAISEPVSVYDRPSEAYRQAAGQLRRWNTNERQEESIEDEVSSTIKSGETERAIQILRKYLLHYGEHHDIDDLMLKDIGILTAVRKSVQIPEESIDLSMVDIFGTGCVQDIVRFSVSYLQEIVSKMPVSPKPQKHYVVQRVCQRLEEDVAYPWNINDLAKEYSFNPVYLGRLFKDETGVCFTDYLIQLRVARAEELIANTNLSIGEVGVAVGYRDQNYFSRIFKKIHRIGPKEYRRLRGTGRG